MKNLIKTFSMAASLALFLSLISSTAFAAAFKSPGLGGSTGLTATPTGKTGWEDADMAIDVGYHYVDDGDSGDSSHIPAVALQLFGKWELGAAFDLQDRDTDDEDDYIFHTKFNFYNAGASALAIGGNLQLIDQGNDNTEGTVYQFYFAATYSSSFFGMPSQSTLVVGKTLGDKDYTDDDSIDFSMGFDLDFLPKYLKGYVHWINDFSNYSYSVDPMGADAGNRGCFNTGFRIAVLKTSRYKWNIDVMMTDALDENRSWTIGTAGGLAF